MFRSPVSNGHNKTAGFSRLSLWRKRKSPRPQEAKGPSSVYYEAASNRHDGKSRIYGFETPYVSCSIRHFPPTTFYSMTLFIISARSSTKNRLKSLCKISFRRIFSISISLNKTTTTTTTVPRKSNSRRSVPRESPLSTFPFTVKIAAMGSRNRSPRCRNPTPRIYIASRFFPTYYTRSTI